MEVKEISYEQYEKFNRNLEFYNLFQTKEMILVRKYNYEDVKVLGMFDNKELVGTVQLLIETIPYFKKKMGTSIKGLNFNTSDEKLLKSFKEAMTVYLKENNFLFFRFDLDTASNFYNADFELLNLEQVQNSFVEKFPHDNKIKDKLSKAGYVNFNIGPNYMGRSPKWSMLVDTSSEECISSQFNRSVKRAIKLAKDIGIEVINTSKTNDDIEVFYNLHSLNAKKNQINIMDIEYYKELFRCPHIKLFLVKIDKEKFVKYAEDKCESNNSPKNEKLLNLAKSYEKGEYILGHVSGMFGKVGYDMFTGLNYDYKDLGTKEYLMKVIFKESLKNGISYYDFWGIVAGKQYEEDPMYPIYLFKKKFSNIIVEYPGFWDIYTNKYLYKLFVYLYKKRYKKNH